MIWGKLWTSSEVEMFQGSSTGIDGLSTRSMGRSMCSNVLEIIGNMSIVHSYAHIHPQ